MSHEILSPVWVLSTQTTQPQEDVAVFLMQLSSVPMDIIDVVPWGKFEGWWLSQIGAKMHKAWPLL